MREELDEVAVAALGGMPLTEAEVEADQRLIESLVPRLHANGPIQHVKGSLGSEVRTNSARLWCALMMRAQYCRETGGARSRRVR